VGLAIASPGGPQFVRAQVAPDEYSDAVQHLADMMDTLTSLRGVIDRAQFDLDALSLQLAFADPSESVGWMRDHIAFEPYIGLLRGAEGTLMSGAGNSLDQAVLLAHLLKDAGFEARVARGRLSSSQARELVQQTRKRDPEPGPFVDKEAATEILDRLATSGAEPNGDAARMIASVLDPPRPHRCSRQQNATPAACSSASRPSVSM
jgi:hypothetical protein